MAFCGKCGAQLEEGKKFCPACGAPVENAAPAAAAPQYEQAPPQYQAPQPQYQAPQYQAPPQAAAPVFNGNRTMAILAVVLPFLFFLPLVTGDKTEFDKFWANQSLLLLLLSVLASILSVIFIGFLLYIVEVVFWIIALIAVCGGQMKPLPLIGQITIIK